jgi:hypothetical protein
LTDAAAVEKFLEEQQPDGKQDGYNLSRPNSYPKYLFYIVLVHCAAERRPDVAEKDQDGCLRVRHDDIYANELIN